MHQHEKINYVEFPAVNLAETKRFFTEAFGWTFEDFGPDYTAFSNEGLDGGFYTADLAATTDKGTALIIFYSKELEETQKKVEQVGGTITKDIFTFPGGRRFEFTEPSGNEFAVWSDL
jgi:predicted enzyme related to lactoylglutathione lyase